MAKNKMTTAQAIEILEQDSGAPYRTVNRGAYVQRLYEAGPDGAEELACVAEELGLDAFIEPQTNGSGAWTVTITTQK